jgi:8-oxo-dGTP pyrophosphatase MutT (NUDIX family)
MTQLNNNLPTTKTRLRVAVVALFVIADEVLMIHQMTFPEPDCWDLPGGGIEPDEPILEALKREVQEETGIRSFTVDRVLTIHESFTPKSETDIVHSLNLIYQCSLPTKVTELYSEEAEVGPKGIQWVAIASLTPENCSGRGWLALKTAGLIQ